MWACDNIMYMSNLGRRGTAAFLTEQEGRAGGYCGTGLTPAPEEETDLKSAKVRFENLFPFPIQDS